MYEELNKKLVEFAGFITSKVDIERQGEHGIIDSIITPNGKQYFGEMPDFTDPDFGVAYCFKWLVPKVEYYFSYQFNETLLKDESKRWRCLLSNKGFGKEKFESFGATPALALCLAIEKLIDG